MQFKVPQFIDIEDKLFGPFTFKEFAYLAGGGGVSFLIWRTIESKFIAIILILPVAGLAVCLTFVRINGKPFINILEAALTYLFKNKMYIWKKMPSKTPEKPAEIAPQAEPYNPKLSTGKLKEIAWSLDVMDMKKK